MNPITGRQHGWHQSVARRENGWRAVTLTFTFRCHRGGPRPRPNYPRVTYPSTVEFVSVLFNESSAGSRRRTLSYWSPSLFICLSSYSHCFSVFLIYSSNAHHKFSEHSQSDPSLRRSLKASRASGWPGADSWLSFLALSHSASLPVRRSTREGLMDAPVCSSDRVPGRQCWSLGEHYRYSIWIRRALVGKSIAKSRDVGMEVQHYCQT